MDYFSKHLRRTWTERSKQGFCSGIEIGGRLRIAPLNPFFPVRAGLNKASFTAWKTLLVELAEEYFKSILEWTTSSVSGATKVSVLREVSSNRRLEAPLM